MSQKEMVLDAIQELPDDATVLQIAERIKFIVGIQEAIDQLNRGEGVPHEEIEREFSKWFAE